MGEKEVIYNTFNTKDFKRKKGLTIFPPLEKIHYTHHQNNFYLIIPNSLKLSHYFSIFKK